MEGLPARILSSRARAQPPVPPPLYGGSRKSVRRRRTPVLLRSGTVARSPCLRAISGASPPSRLGGLRQAAFRRTAPGDRVPRPLHPSRSHLQPASGGAPRWPGFVPLERLSACGQTASDDGLRRGVHPPFPAACPAARLSAHPLLRLAGQLPPRAQAAALPASTSGTHCGPTSRAPGLPEFLCRPDRQKPAALSRVRDRNDDSHRNSAALPQCRQPPDGQLMTCTAHRDHAPRAALPAGLAGSVRPLRNLSSARQPPDHLGPPTHSMFAFLQQPTIAPNPSTAADTTALFPGSCCLRQTKPNKEPALGCGLVHRSVSSACGSNRSSLAQIRRPQAEETSIGNVAWKLVKWPGKKTLHQTTFG